MVICFEICPVQVDNDFFLITNTMGRPNAGYFARRERFVGEKSIHLLDGMLDVQVAGDGQTSADGGDADLCGVENTQGSIRQGTDALGMHRVAEERIEETVNMLRGEEEGADAFHLPSSPPLSHPASPGTALYRTVAPEK